MYRNYHGCTFDPFPENPDEIKLIVELWQEDAQIPGLQPQ